MEEDSSKKSKLSHANFVQNSKPSTSMNVNEKSQRMQGPSTCTKYGGRVEAQMRNRLIQRMLQKQNTYTRDDEIESHSSSRGEKRRYIEDEPCDQNVKRLVTPHSHTNALVIDKKILSNLTVVVNIDSRKDRTAKRIVYVGSARKEPSKIAVKPPVCTNGEIPAKGDKRKPEYGHYTQQGIKRLRVTPKYEHGSDFKPNGYKAACTKGPTTLTANDVIDDVTSGNTEDDNQYYQCSNSCVCTVGPSPTPRPTVRRGYPKLTPLYRKLMQRRLLSTANVVLNECCGRQCSRNWCRRRFPRFLLEDGYGPSDLRVDNFKWGQWKQKPEVKRYDSDDDDWFW